MLTKPDLIAAWWGPDGFSTPEIELDLRPGGRYRFTMQPPDGEAFRLQGEFVEVEHARRLSYTFRWEEPDPDDVETMVTLSLDDADTGTRLAVEQGRFRTEERRDLHRDGWSDGLAKLRSLAG